MPTEDGWPPLWFGEPYSVVGAGFPGPAASLDSLAAAGANSTRTWSTHDADHILDEAEARSLRGLLGIWLGHVEHGFECSDRVQVPQQLKRVRRVRHAAPTASSVDGPARQRRAICGAAHPLRMRYDAPLLVPVDAYFGQRVDGGRSEGWLMSGGCPRSGNDFFDYCSFGCRALRKIQGRAGVVWHPSPDDLDGQDLGVRVAPGATAVVVNAWGREGGEQIAFFAGNKDAGEPYSLPTTFELGREPTSFRIELTPGVAGDITAGFGWSATTATDPAESTSFYVSDIRWVAD